MKIRFAFRRILALVAVVILLAFVYFMVRAGHSVSQENMGNPADKTILAHEVVQPERMQGGWLVLEDPEDEISQRARPAVEFALSCLGYLPAYAETASRELLVGATEGVVVTATVLENIGDVQLLFDYARDGGLLTFAVRPEVDDAFRSIYQQLGIYEHAFFAWSQGIHLEEGLLTREPYSVEGAWLDNSVIELHVEQTCSVYATNDKGVPLMWSLEYGSGNILVMNNSLITYKATGGLLPALWGQMGRPLIYPVVNARVFALEAFPLPADVNLDYMKEVYLRSTQAFVRDVWWSDMTRFSRARGIPFTTGFLTGYESESAYPSHSVLLEDMDMHFYTKELAKYDGEIGFTGFNQKPLYFGQATAGMSFEPWSSQDTAVQRTGDALDYFKASYPQYKLYAYLPPERVLDETGYEAVKALMPDLQVVCGDFYDTDLWYQDFGVGEDGVVSFPVVSTGFGNSAENQWNLLCVANALGVMFHSGDVSDIVLETDPANSWNVRSEAFFEFADTCIAETDYLDGTTVTQASVRLREMLGMDPAIDVVDGQLRVTIPPAQMPEQASFMVFCPGQEPKAVVGVSVEELGAGRYFITSTLNQFTLELVKV